MANKKLTQEEVKQLATLQDNRINVLAQLGSVELSIMRLEKEKLKGLDAIQDLEKTEQYYYKLLEEKYGRGRIDFNTREFIPD